MTTQEVRAEKFTPGKWRYVTDDFNNDAHEDKCGSIVGGEEAFIIAEVCGDVPGHLANARLLAASPSMYAALTRAHVVIRDAITLRVPIDGDAEGTLKAVEKALRLALDGAA